MTFRDPDSRARLATELSQVRARVGAPSYRRMAKVLTGQRKTDAVGETTLRNAATAEEPTPKWTTVVQFVTACRLIAEQDRPGIDDRFFDPELWYTRWKALGEPNPLPSSWLLNGATVARPGMTSGPCLTHDPGGVAGSGGVDGPLMGTGPLVGLFVTWVPGVDA
ncbi:hypothetical protein [Nocardia sp. NPDC004711]